MGLALDEPKDSDKVFEFDNLKFVVEEKLLSSLGKLTIDHVDDGSRSGLAITSENPVGSKPAENSCGTCKC